MKNSFFGAGGPRILTFALMSLAMTVISAPTALAQAKISPDRTLIKLGPIPAAAQFDSTGHLDVDAATRAYLDTVPADKRAASNKYFEGGYWIMLWSALYTVVIALLLLFTGVSKRMRDLAVRLTRYKWIQAWIYFAEFILTSTILSLPWNIYVGFYREHVYNQSHQPFAGWLREQMIGPLVILVFGAIAFATVYTVIRRLLDTWHIWGSVLVVTFQMIAIMIAPVYIAPLFNTYTPLSDPEVTIPVLKMAHANGIKVDKLYEVNASKQTTQISANVSGLFDTTRINVNDNLLHQASIEEIEDGLGHEMGHYVLNHIMKMLCQFALLILIGFCLLRVWLQGMQERWGDKWGTTGAADPAMFPAVVLAYTVMMLFLTPVLNNITRTMECEADMYGLNAAREPDGRAQVALKLGQYRKLEPGPIEEFLFYDHPSGYARIHAAMQWKSENSHTTTGY
ncbi:Peptidase, M48 family [Acidisarcina polymorpha]|uniref:Peptidase, M48 family n=1 Tax=Acidisarcina polymorpha TaxID=2211140 RepID=A0A2Z5FZ89_9BACT|nr:M48 family metallopeptidase [Acidisarcina polymorpha]AXC12171.1 Peptidase, M48 family [Acidisarcina polymorpha]